MTTKWILLLCWCVAGTAMAGEPTKYVLSENKDRLVFLDNPMAYRDNQPVVAFAYYEVMKAFPDYLFVSIMQADCTSLSRVQLTQLSAVNTKYGLTKKVPDLTESEKQWRTVPLSSGKGLAWKAVCRLKERDRQHIRSGTAMEIVADYQAVVAGKPPVIR